jgi:Rrf2 family protein
MLSQTSEYALRAVLHIAEHGNGRRVSVNEIAAALGAPRNYLSKILHQLARDGVLESSRGPKGGFQLARDAADVPLSVIVQPGDPVADARQCLLGRAVCSDDDPCAAHARWKAVAERVREFFSRTTIADLKRG